MTFLFVVCAILAIVGCTRFGPADPEVDELVSLEGGGWEGEESWIYTRYCTHKRQAHTSDQPDFSSKKCRAMKARLEQQFT